MARRRYKYRYRRKSSTMELNGLMWLFGILMTAELLFRYWKPLLILLTSLVTATYLLNTIKKSRERQAILRSGIDQIDKMSGIDFEHRLLHHFNYSGWKVKMTATTGDFGADLVGKDDRGRKVVIQAKRYSKNVGIDAVQEVLGAKAQYNAHRMLVVTNSSLTKQAKQLAKVAGVEVWEREDLIRNLTTR